MTLLRAMQEKLVILASAVRTFFDPLAGAEDTVKWFQPGNAWRVMRRTKCVSPPRRYRWVRISSSVSSKNWIARFWPAPRSRSETASSTSRRARDSRARLASRRRELLLDSPFDLAHRVFCGFPADLPAPEDPEFLEESARFLWRALKITRGRTLVLFNSWGWLRKTHAILEPHAGKLGFTLLAQGEMSKRELIRAFRDDIHSVLLATAGYREGIDVPGESLCSLVLHRLPFASPGEPVMEAASRGPIERAGGDPFREYSVPAAAIAYVQARLPDG